MSFKIVYRPGKDLTTYLFPYRKCVFLYIVNVVILRSARKHFSFFKLIDKVMFAICNHTCLNTFSFSFFFDQWHGE